MQKRRVALCSLPVSLDLFQHLSRVCTEPPRYVPHGSRYYCYTSANSDGGRHCVTIVYSCILECVCVWIRVVAYNFCVRTFDLSFSACVQGICESIGLQFAHRIAIPWHRRLCRAPIPGSQQLLQRSRPQDRYLGECLQAGCTARGSARRHLSQHRVLCAPRSWSHGVEFSNGNLFPSIQLFHGDVCCSSSLFTRLEDS